LPYQNLTNDRLASKNLASNNLVINGKILDKTGPRTAAPDKRDDQSNMRLFDDDRQRI
jgi:hypothetical protein